jgi:hypothetical protein
VVAELVAVVLEPVAGVVLERLQPVYPQFPVHLRHWADLLPLRQLDKAAVELRPVLLLHLVRVGRHLWI